MERQIRTSGKAVVIRDGRLLAIKLHDSDGDFYILPGGGQTDTRYHPDTNQTGCEWLDIGMLNTSPLYPSRLRRAIMDLCEGKPTPVYLGNECVGDPEITD